LVRRFQNHEFDLVSVGRGHIGDPDWVNKVAAGRYSDIRMFTKKDVLGDLEIAGLVEEAHRGS
jgi:2,4-dienoyl-CoA reductase-like NADH-dependent reductase (Old Yellow Enzyme family)